MNKISCMLATMLLCCSIPSYSAEKPEPIDHVDPPFWYAGMKNPELQILVHGPNISSYGVSIDYPGITIKEIVQVDSPNYLFLYLNIGEETLPGNFDIVFSQGKKKLIRNYELKERNKKVGALGFSTEDVLYLITPDRFANGDPSNDNLPDLVQAPAQNRPNGQNGPQNQARPQNGQMRPQANRPAAQGRGANGRHGGDIKGVQDHLDYIQELGMTTIWLNPVQSNSFRSYHGYAINDFYSVDPRFGTMEEYIAFIDEAHARGMKVVMDMIFNHCGGDHWWMQDLPTKDWLNFDNTFTNCNHLKWTMMDPHAAPSEKKGFTDGWFNSGMPDLNQRNYHVATYLIQQSMWWIEYTRIDGIRQDTYPYMDFDFGARWCEETFAEYPDFNITGETWYPVGSNLPAWWQAGSKLNDKDSKLKSVMDFNLAFITETAFDEANANAERNSKGLFNIYMSMANDYLYPDTDNILIFLDNHDLSRFNRKEDVGLNKYKQGIAFLATTRGIPQIYYGTELLMTGTKGEGDGNIRKDVPGGWPGDEVNAFTPEGRTAIQNEAYNYMAKLLNWRKTSKAVTHGKLIQYAPVSNHGDCYVYARIADDETVLVVLNGSDKDANISMSRYSDVIGEKFNATDVITGKEYNLSDKLEVPARGTYVFELK